MSRGLSYQAVHPCNPMLSQIVRVDARDHAAIGPDLALSWELAGDGLTWTFHVRGEALWHDGSPVTAADLKFSLDRIIRPPDGLAVGRAGTVARYVPDTGSVWTPDGGTLTVRTRTPAASFLANLASVYVSVYPRGATQALDPPSMVLFEQVVGSGPFRAASAVRGSAYKMVRNESYYEPGVPYLDGLWFLVMPEPAVRLAALKAHEVDVIAVITETEAEDLEAGYAGRIRVLKTPSAGGNTLQMNMEKPPFDDARVRRAVNLAIDRDEARLALGGGLDGAIMPPGGPWALDPAEVRALPGHGDKGQERAEARQLLARAGFPDGLDVVLSTRADPFFETLSAFVAGQLATVGIRARVVPVEAVAYQDLLARGEHAMIGHSHSFALDDPDAILPGHYACGGAENFPRLCEAEIDRLIEEQSRTLDPEKRKSLVDEIQRRVWDLDAKVWFQWSLRRTALWENVRGLEPGGASLYQGRRMDTVWLEPPP
ncbi:MAG: ABC transporter substrate-binding protein [Gemmatimonadetes bacterium]|nr:ABC transporter substrate-binding protein [Gemmatimonadota bacterium]